MTAIGIDLGGTNLRVALVDASGRRLAERFEPLVAGADGDATLAHVIRLVVDVCATRMALTAMSDVPIGIGLAVAGVLDEQDRLVAGMTNLPALAGRPIVSRLNAATLLDVRVENDARAAMLGEARFGAARGARDVLMLTLGTGIGGGLLLDGRLRRGPRRRAGEIGLALVPDGRGAWVPLETLASPGGLKRWLGVDIAAIFQGAAMGHARSKAAVNRIAELIAVAIVNTQVVLDLELALLSGGMTRAGAPLLDAIRDAVNRLSPPEFRGELRVDYASLGEWAGAMGAAALWLGDNAGSDAGPRDTAQKGGT